MHLHYMIQLLPFIRSGQVRPIYLWKAGTRVSQSKPVLVQRALSRNFRQWRPQVCPKKPMAATKKLLTPFTQKLTLAFIFPGIFKTRLARKTRDDIASVDLADIPKEVYIDDLKVKSRRKPGFLEVFLHKVWAIIRLFFRSCQLIITFTPFVVTYPFSYVSSRFYSIWLRVLVFTCERSGPTLVKFGQWASTRRDLFSKEFCDRFSKLHRRTSPHTWYYTKIKLEKAFGKNWRNVLVRIDDKDAPLGSGCVAQVYKAYMPSEMVVDDDVLEEILADIDDHDQTPDYLESFEIFGFSKFFQRFTQSDTEAEDSRPALSFSKTKQKVPALSSVSQKVADDERKKQEREDRLREGQQPEEERELTDMELAEKNGLVPVAVKVLHPGIYRAVQRDLMILRFLSVLAELLIPRLRWLSLRDCVEEFADIMERQVDLRREAKCLEKFYENFENVPNVRFPRPVRPFVKRNVLVETFEEGEPIEKFLQAGGMAEEGIDEDEADERASNIAHKLADIGADALLQMIFLDNFIHGDLHPGNILVQNSEDYNPQEQPKLTLVDICDTTVINVKEPDCHIRLVMLDVGITATLSDKDKVAFYDLFRAIVLGEGDEVGALFLEHSVKQECSDKAKFIREVATLVNEARRTTIKLGKIQVSDLLTSVFSVLSRHKVKLESNFVSVILAIMVLEGIGRSLDPELDIMSRARPILMKAV